MILRIIAVVLLCALVVSGAAADNGVNYCVAPTAQATTPQADASACFSPDALTAAQTACATLGVDQFCLGTFVPTGSSTGVIAPLDGTNHLGGSGALTLIKMQADLPATAQPIQLVLFGDASLDNAVTGVPQTLPTVTVINGPTNILNLRDTPSQNGNVVTTMTWGEQLTADGRSSDGQWLRVQTDKGAAWVLAKLIKVKPGDDASTLAVLDSTITHWMQSMTLTSPATSCGGGLLVQAANHETAHLEVNGALLTFGTATLLLQGQANQALTVEVISGSTDLAANGKTVTAKAGTQATVDGQSAPQIQNSYAFSSLTSAPLSLLSSGSLACVAGVTSTGAAATLYRTPGGQSAGTLDASGSATIVGQATTSDGKIWWLLDNGRWVAQSDVQTAGVCDAVPQASTAQQQASQPPVSFANNLVPQGRSIWQAHTGPDNLSGTCTAPPIAQCDHLAAVTTQPGGTITWLGQEPAPYTLRPSGANTFSFSGRNQLNNANFSLSVTFTGATTWVGTMHLVYDSDPGCTHTFNYTADRMR